MGEAKGAPAALAGKTFDCMFDSFVPRLTFGEDDALRVRAKIGDVSIDQIVRAETVDVGGNLFIVSWVEDNGNFIVQLQDHARGVVHNHARLADGQVFRAKGALSPVVS